MRILVRLELNRKFLEIISRFYATLSAIGCNIKLYLKYQFDLFETLQISQSEFLEFAMISFFLARTRFFCNIEIWKGQPKKERKKERSIPATWKSKTVLKCEGTQQTTRLRVQYL